MIKQIRLTALAMAGALGLSLAAPGIAHAGSKGKQNTAIALGAVAAYGIIKKKPVIAGVAGAGAIYSYVQSRKDAGKERERKRQAQARQARNRRVAYLASQNRYRSTNSGWRRGGTPPGWSHGKKTGWTRHAKRHH